MTTVLTRRPMRRPVPRAQTVRQVSIPAPVEGWETQRPLVNLGAKRAARLDNIIPRAGYVELREGCVEHATGAGAAVQTLMVWRGATSEKLFAAADSDIFDVTAASSAGSAVASGYSSPRWQWLNFANPAGAHLLMVNGADAPQRYSGSAWSSAAITGSGLISSNLIDIAAYKGRILLAEKDAARFWHLAPQAVGGSAESFELGPIYSKGGNLLAIGTWSIDGGGGPDDLAVFVSDQGQVAVYQGNNPGDSTDWGLVGVYDLGQPLGRRCMVKLGADLGILTTAGLVPLSSVIALPQGAQSRSAITNRISEAFQTAAASYGSNFGWQVQHYPAGELLLVNIPTAELSRAEQYVMNATTGAWCRFTGWNALCWAVYDGRPFFGGANGTIYEGDTGTGDAGLPIVADLTAAWSDYGAPSRLKQWVMLRTAMRSRGVLAPAVEMVTDFDDKTPTAVPSIPARTTPLWDVAVWDVDSWSQQTDLRLDWTKVVGLGFYGAVRMRITTQPGSGGSAAVAQILGWDLHFNIGGTI